MQFFKVSKGSLFLATLSCFVISETGYCGIQDSFSSPSLPHKKRFSSKQHKSSENSVKNVLLEDSNSAQLQAPSWEALPQEFWVKILENVSDQDLVNCRVSKAMKQVIAEFFRTKKQAKKWIDGPQSNEVKAYFHDKNFWKGYFLFSKWAGIHSNNYTLPIVPNLATHSIIQNEKIRFKISQLVDKVEPDSAVFHFLKAVEFYLSGYARGYQESLGKFISKVLHSSNLNCSQSQDLLALCYLNGIGVQSDLGLADYYSGLAMKNHPHQLERRPKCYSGEKLNYFLTQLESSEAIHFANLGSFEVLTPKQVQQLEFLAVNLFSSLNDQLNYANYNLRVTKDYQKSLPFFENAASRGSPKGRLQLANFYSHGIGVAQDYEKALQLYRLAAEQGEAQAWTELARHYQNGLGVELDYVRAVHFLEHAVQKGDFRAYSYLARLYQTGSGVPLDYYKAADFYLRANFQGVSLPSQVDLAIIFETGTGVPVNFVLAAQLYELPAHHGDLRAQLHLALLFLNGWGVEPSYVIAAELFGLAAQQGDSSAQTQLGLLYLNGLGVMKNPQKAVELFKLASAQGNSEAQAYLRQIE